MLRHLLPKPARRTKPTACTGQKPYRARNPYRAGKPGRRQPEARTARAPFKARVVARVPTGVPDRTALRAGASRQTAPRTRQKPPEARTAPASRAEASQKPVPRAPPFKARVVARVPTGVPARDSVTRQTAPRTRQEPAASAYRTLLRFSTITDPVRIRLRRPGIA